MNVIKCRMGRLCAGRQYTINNDAVAKSAEKLSSGYRINRAGDDAAGLAISEKMRSQIRGLTMAAKNSQDAISLVQTAEGALQETHSMLQRMNELAVQAATGTNEDIDRNALAKEFEQLKKEINDVAEQTTFNNMKILDGSLSNSDGYVRSAATAGVTVTSSAVEGASDVAVTNGVTPSTTAPVAAEFKLQFSDNGTPNIAAGAAISITVGTQTINATASQQITSSAAFADEFAGKSVTLNGHDYSISSDGAGTLTFTQTNQASNTGTITPATDYGTPSASNSNVSVAQTGTDVDGEAPTATQETNVVTLNADALKVGDTITIGDKTIEVVEAGGTPTDANNTAFEIGGSTQDLITAVAGLSPTDLTIADDGNGSTVTITQGQGTTASTKVSLTSSSDGKNYKNTVEFDTAKMKDGDVFKLSIGGATVEVEFKASEYKTEAGKSANEKFAEAVAKALDDEGVTVTQKGNAITFTGAKVAESDLKLDSITDTDADSYPTNAIRIQVGALENEQLSIGIEAMNTAGLGLDGFNLDTQNEAGMAITAVRAAINKVSDQRATLGAMQNRLEHKIANLNVSTENLSAAESRIRDVDMASEMTTFTKNNILSQAATAMLAQANALPQNVLSLLG